MNRRIRLWSSISVAALMSAGALSGCGQGGEDEAASGDGASETAQSEAAAEKEKQATGVEGEGEGQAAPADPATDDVAYLTQLGLIRGHLHVGLELFRADALDASTTHMKHPENELYAKMKPAFKARGADGFAEELEALAKAVESGAARDKVESAYQDLLDAVDEAETHVAGPDPATKLQVAVNLVRTAGDEYGIGVKDGKVVNAHEYQDAYGFTVIARRLVDSIDTSGQPDLAEAVKTAKAQLDKIEGAWPSVTDPGTVDMNAGQIHGAAARMEIAALSVE